MGFPRAPLVPEMLQTAEQEVGPSFHHFSSALLIISLLLPLPNIINASSMPEKNLFSHHSAIKAEALKGKMEWSYSHSHGTMVWTDTHELWLCPFPGPLLTSFPDSACISS